MRILVKRCAICNLGFVVKKDAKTTEERQFCNKCRKIIKKGGEENDS